ncbi:dicarboxylate/amino acid:cation symporter [Photobacterium toruni]|uniref:Dicarboxylate/amino acid:cation symporter n=1 Tax=Photobacterium toruni TaxID=1935446 RepID=A0A1T4QYT7_9GAMM|nr:dicarboxylate/amino acid:cation symporter [Photobacterium toruni]MEC6830509.1 dicarboxylate/amino acid:cation symporter [Photobacterium toruni]SKA08883.1 Proton glutamate symport protein [Photobacterium toruni]
MKSINTLTKYILIFMLLGIGIGFIINQSFEPKTQQSWSDNITLLTDIFLNLIKMVIAPLIFCTLTSGIMKLKDISAIRNIGGRAISWFIVASVLSIFIGLIMVVLIKPGSGMNLISTNVQSLNIDTNSLSFRSFISHMIPTSIVGAMASNQILQIVIFSLFFGIAGASIPQQQNEQLVSLLEAISNTMLKVTNIVMLFAPFAIFASISAIIATQGLNVLLNYTQFIFGFYTTILITSLILIGLGYIFIKQQVVTLVSMLKDPILIAFSTTSSEAAYPKTLEQLIKFGCSKNLASFVLPLGYSFNLVGSMCYCSFSAMFIAQAYNISLSNSEIFTLMLTLMLASKGIAGVPRSALVVLAATLPNFHIPASGILLLMGIDHILDMGRSAINVLGNGITTAVISHNIEGLPNQDLDLDDPLLEGTKMNG